MADLSGYTPIYIRTTGNDATGDGSSGSPYATAQKGFDIAAATPSGNYVLDFGAGSFGGVVLAQDWPARVAVRGAGAAQSFVGGITSVGAENVFDFENYVETTPASPGASISIVSDNTINIGNISTTGGSVVDSGSNGASGGDVALTDSTCGNIASIGGQTNAGNGGPGGNISLTSSACGEILSSGWGGSNTYLGGGGGSVTLSGSTSGGIQTLGGEGGNLGGSGGIVTLTAKSSSGNISSVGGFGGSAYSVDGGAAGGNISMADSSSGNVTSSGGGHYVSAAFSAPGGTVTLSGYSVMPSLVSAASVVATNLKKGRGVNGSSILGIA